MKVVVCCIHIVVVGGGVNDKLDIVRPTMSAVRHFDPLAIVVVVGNGAFEHAEPLWCGEVTAHHANIDFR